MIRLRKQYNMSTFMSVTFTLAINFAWVPWPWSGGLAAVLIIPLFVSGLTFIDWLVIYGIVGVFGTLILPPLATNLRRRRPRPVITAPARIAAPRGAPDVASATSMGPEEPDG
jgi:hypothetical protein